MKEKTFSSVTEMFEDHERELNKMWARRFWERVLPNGIMGYYSGYALTHPWKVVGRIGDELRLAWQRVTRGYDDLLLWNLYSCITEYSLAALKYAKEEGMGYPSDLASEEWDTKLQVMIDGFEAAKRIEDAENIEGLKEDRALFERGFDLMKTYYFSLWD